MTVVASEIATEALGAVHPGPPPKLEILDVAEVADRIASGGPASWLIRELFPADAHGVFGAEPKAGKTAAAYDLLVSVATGTPWLEHFPCTPGTALAFLGEGGHRPALRWLEGIVRSRGGDLADLKGRLRLCNRVPHLQDEAHLREIATELDAHPAQLVVVDPLYLAARGADGRSLYGMGEMLERVQHLCQEARSALVVITHWNRSGEGKGVSRFTGAGPAEWGRVLGSAAVRKRSMDPDGASNVLLEWEFAGGEIAHRSFQVRRRVRAADLGDLDSPLVYEVEVTEAALSAEDGLSISQRRVLASLPEPPGWSWREIGDALAADGLGPPLKRTTIQGALEELAGAGLADAERPGNGIPNRWWRVS